MKLTTFFSIKRFWLLLRKDFYTQSRSCLIGLGAIFSILFIVNISSILTSSQWNFNLVFYPLTLFIGGFIVTSMSFTELAAERSRIPYLTLPASILEKFVSKLAVTSIGYTIVSLLLYFVFSVVAFAFNSLVFWQAHPIFNPLDPVILRTISIYLVTQSIFLFGAVFFRGNAFIKTVLSLFALAIVYTGFTWLAGIVTYYSLSMNTSVVFPAAFMNGGPGSYPFFQGLRAFGEIVLSVIKVLFWAVMAPLFWVISFFRLKETEV
ncbi:MAG: hypothetical protein JW969_19670 [Spirochaetales bacterium]|nr:hypothetical protein [Spirochaetales bacterium]